MMRERFYNFRYNKIDITLKEMHVKLEDCSFRNEP